MRARQLIFLALFVTLAAAFAAEAQQSEPRRGGSLRFAVAKEIVGLNPFVNTRSIDHNVRTLVFEPLLAQQNQEIKPHLATSFAVSKDAREFTLDLRRGVKFHNGKEVTAEDVKWSIEYAMEPKNTAYGKFAVSGVGAVDVFDKYRIKVTLKEPSASFLSNLTTIQSFPVTPKGSLQVGEKPDRYPPGTGPYQLDQWRQGQYLALKKFPDYWKKEIPYIDQLTFRPIDDDTVRFVSLRSGDVDMIERLPHQDVERIRRGEFGGIELAFANAAGFRSITTNVQRPPFNNVKVRQAIALAIDRQEIINGAFWGVGTPINQKGIPETYWYFALKEQKRALEKARALLREAGYPNGIKIKFFVRKGEDREAQVIQSQLRQAGIDAELDLADFANYTARHRAGDFELTLSGGSVLSDPDANYAENFATEVGKERLHNRSGWSNPRADQLFREGRITTDPEKRRRIYQEIVELLHEEAPQIFTLLTPYVFAYRTYLKGFKTDPDGRFFSPEGGIPGSWLGR